MNRSDNPSIHFLADNTIKIHRFSTKAMATIFELYIRHQDKNYAAQAANAAFSELDRLEQDLSRFIENSEVSRINALGQFEKLPVSIDVFNCLKQCIQIYQDTKGAFDITLGHLTNYWKKYALSNQPRVHHKDIMKMMEQVGLSWLQLDMTSYQVTLMNESINLDFGGFGKGYAIDRMIALLFDWEIKSGLIHGGRSTVAAFGAVHNPDAWPLSISHPHYPDTVIKKIGLSGRALSGSGLQKGRHIIDPRSGYPAANHLAAWALAPQAATSDALSTAFMIMSTEEIKNFCSNHPKIAGIIIENNAQNTIHRFGNWQD